jgi:hypothetical protein
MVENTTTYQNTLGLTIKIITIVTEFVRYYKYKSFFYFHFLTIVGGNVNAMFVFWTRKLYFFTVAILYFYFQAFF